MLEYEDFSSYSNASPENRLQIFVAAMRKTLPILETNLSEISNCVAKQAIRDQDVYKLITMMNSTTERLIQGFEKYPNKRSTIVTPASDEEELHMVKHDMLSPLGSLESAAKLIGEIFSKSDLSPSIKSLVTESIELTTYLNYCLDTLLTW